MSDWLTNKATAFVKKRLRKIDPKLKHKLALALQEDAYNEEPITNSMDYSQQPCQRPDNMATYFSSAGQPSQPRSFAPCSRTASPTFPNRNKPSPTDYMSGTQTHYPIQCPNQGRLSPLYNGSDSSSTFTKIGSDYQPTNPVYKTYQTFTGSPCERSAFQTASGAGCSSAKLTNIPIGTSTSLAYTSNSSPQLIAPVYHHQVPCAQSNRPSSNYFVPEHFQQTTGMMTGGGTRSTTLTYLEPTYHTTLHNKSYSPGIPQQFVYPYVDENRDRQTSIAFTNPFVLDSQQRNLTSISNDLLGRGYDQQYNIPVQCPNKLIPDNNQMHPQYNYLHSVERGDHLEHVGAAIAPVISSGGVILPNQHHSYSGQSFNQERNYSDDERLANTNNVDNVAMSNSNPSPQSTTSKNQVKNNDDGNVYNVRKKTVTINYDGETMESAQNKWADTRMSSNTAYSRGEQVNLSEPHKPFQLPHSSADPPRKLKGCLKKPGGPTAEYALNYPHLPVGVRLPTDR